MARQMLYQGTTGLLPDPGANSSSRANSDSTGTCAGSGSQPNQTGHHRVGRLR